VQPGTATACGRQRVRRSCQLGGDVAGRVGGGRAARPGYEGRSRRNLCSRRRRGSASAVSRAQDGPYTPGKPPRAWKDPARGARRGSCDARVAQRRRRRHKKAAADRRRSHGLTGAGLDPAHGHPAARGALHGRARRQGARARARRERGGGGGGVRGRHAGRWCSRSTGARPRSSSRNFVVLLCQVAVCCCGWNERAPRDKTMLQ